MTKYRCVLFDLDHTLWDYETNSAETLEELYRQYELEKLGAVSVPIFLETFATINAEIWDQYDRGLIDREVLRLQRFHRVLTAAGIDDYEMSLRFSSAYLTISPEKKNLIPGSLDILQYLSEKYPLYIITNGFDEIQYTKLRSSGITSFFKKVFTSEKVGHKKPSREIFEHALATFAHRSEQAIMVGDNLLTDIAGARNAGIDQVYFNPHALPHEEIVTYEIQTLPELRNIL